MSSTIAPTAQSIERNNNCSDEQSSSSPPPPTTAAGPIHSPSSPVSTSNSSPHFPLFLQNTHLSPSTSRHSTPGSFSIFLNRTPTVQIDASQLPNKLVILVSPNNLIMLQYLLVTCCLPGCLSVLANQAGSFEEFHFEKSKSEESGGGGGGGEKVTKVTMTRTTRSFSSVRRHPTVLVEDVGTEDEEMLEEQSSENSNTEGSNGGKEAPNKAFIVIDGVTGQKTKEDSVIINHTKIITSGFQKPSVDHEGETSCLIKAFCSHALSYDEYSWISNHSPCLLPDVSKMSAKEKKRHNILMLQLRLQKIQILQEQQALGRVISAKDLGEIAMQPVVASELYRLRESAESTILMMKDELSDL